MQDDDGREVSWNWAIGAWIAKSQGGPFIGPKGGKWADAKHTQHWEQQSLDLSGKLPHSGGESEKEESMPDMPAAFEGKTAKGSQYKIHIKNINNWYFVMIDFPDRGVQNARVAEGTRTSGKYVAGLNAFNESVVKTPLTPEMERYLSVAKEAVERANAHIRAQPLPPGRTDWEREERAQRDARAYAEHERRLGSRAPGGEDEGT